MESKDLTTGSIPRHIRDLALPASIGLFFQTMYNVVDTYYAGKESTIALAAVGLSFPVFLLILSASSGLSRGSAGLISNAIGAKRVDDQKRYTSQAVSLGLLLSVVLAILGLIIAEPIFLLMGAEGEYLDVAKSYITPIFLGAVFFILAGLSNAILSSSGDTKTFGIVLVVGFFLNLVFDPWFMKGGFGVPALGVAGIAWATVVIQALGSIYLVSTVARRGLIDLRNLSAFRPDLTTWKEIAIQSLPATFNILSISIGFFTVTWFLQQYGESAVAAYGVTTRIEQIALMPTFGLYAAIMAMVGQNNGAKKIGRIKETMRFCNTIGFIINVVMSIFMFIFSPQLMSLFTEDPEVIRQGVICITILAPIQWSYILSATHIAMLQALKKPTYGFFESITRKIILPVPILYVLVIVYSKEIDYIWYCNAAINVVMTGITIAFARWVLKQIEADCLAKTVPEAEAASGEAAPGEATT